MATPTATLGAFLRRLKQAMTAEALAPLPDRGLVEKFLATRDEAAFQAIIHRHGPMVFRVCRRVLHQEQDVEDAFQATFLVLAREARTIRKQASLASWLHGVAYRAALKARAGAVRRRECPAEAEGPARQAALPDDVSWKEILALLDEELARLPDKLRAPLVLCYLEGLTQDEAAHQLGWSKITCRRHLERGRKLLGVRLARRGVTLSAALLGPLLTECAAAAAVSPALIASTCKAVAALATEKAAAAASPPVCTLVQEAGKVMFAKKLNLVASLLLMGILFAGAGLWVHRAVSAPQPGPQRRGTEARASQEQPPADSPKEGKAKTIQVRGRVLGPDGQPFAGAKLYLAHYGRGKTVTYSVRATSGKDGRFDFTLDRSELGKVLPDKPVGPRLGIPTFANAVEDAVAVQAARVGQVAAVADGYGLDWARIDRQASQELTLRLAKDVSVSGRILDQDGKAVAGAKLRVTAVAAYPGEDLKGVLEDMRTKKMIPPGLKRWLGSLPRQPEVVTTAADGRFRVAGLGRERVVILELQGPAIASTHLWVMTRAGDTVVGKVKLYAATFRFLAAASRPIRGVVRDKETGKPIPGALVWVQISGAIRTDKEGRYEVLGCPKSETYVVYARPNTERHFAVATRFDDTRGLGPLKADIRVPRGAVVLRGRVTDKRTGKPIPGVRVHYFALFPNPEVTKLADYADWESTATTGADGSFEVPALPGSGILGAVAPEADAYQSGKITARELVDFLDKYKEPHPVMMNENLLQNIKRTNTFTFLPQRYFHALCLIHAEKKDKEIKRDLVLQPRTGPAPRVAPAGRRKEVK
jgi:RNA polymerase sigma factor (sigma-70 family)